MAKVKKSITEAPVVSTKPLIETLGAPSVEVIVESDVEGKPKKYKVRGHFGNYNEATANKRLYPKSLWEREITKLEKAMSDRQVFGTVDHPASGKTDLLNVSHVITKLWLDNNKVMGEAEILDTAPGLHLQALLKGGCKLGVSSRGYGSTKPDQNGTDVVQDDYKLETFDFVANPAAGAYPQVFLEWKGEKVEAKDITREMLEETAPDILSTIRAEKEEQMKALWADNEIKIREEAVAAAKDDLKGFFGGELVNKIAEAKKELYSEVKAELLQDPSVAAAKTALDNIKNTLLPFMLDGELKAKVESAESEFNIKKSALEKTIAEQELKIKGLESSNSELEETLREVGFQLFVEKILDGNAEGRALIGDMKDYSSVDQIRTKAEEVKALLASKNAKKEDVVPENVVKADVFDKISKELEIEKSRADRLSEELTRSSKMMEAYEVKLSSLEETNEILASAKRQADNALQEALEEVEQAKTQLYAERKLTNNPKAGKIRAVLESTLPKTKEQVDKIAESFTERSRDPEDLQAVRARVRSMTRGGRGYTALEEEQRVQREDVGILSEVGLTATEFNALAGIKKK